MRIQLVQLPEKKKKFVPLLTTNSLLILLLTLTSYLVATGTLEGIKLSFHHYLSKDCKWFNHTQNTLYKINLFNSEIDFIFKDGSSKTRLQINAPSMLQAHIIKNIQR